VHQVVHLYESKFVFFLSSREKKPLAANTDIGVVVGNCLKDQEKKVVDDKLATLFVVENFFTFPFQKGKHFFFTFDNLLYALVFCFDNILRSTARLNSCRPNYFSGLSRHLTLYSRDVTEDSEESIELNVSLKP